MAYLREPAEAGCQRDAGDRLIAAMSSETQRKANLRTGLILAGIAVVFGLGFVLRIVVFGG